jgi:hypothetical protein
MSSWLGFRNVGDQSKLVFAVNTHSASTGAATDATGDPAYRVYEDETGTPILTGTMGKLDDANTTGFYSEELTISSGNGFEAGKTYTIYITATVGSIAGTTERHFACWPATINSQIDSNVVQINGDATAAANLEKATDGTGYNLGGGSIVAASVTGAVGSVTGNVGGNVAGSVNSVTTGVTLAAGAITSSAIATGAITSTAFASQAITGTAIQDGAISANKLGTGAITSGKFATGAITADAIAAGAISVSEIADGAITATKFGAGAITSTVVDATANSAIADAVWDEAMSGHTISGTYGSRIPRSQNSNVEVQITGSGHIAADVHEFQAGVIEDTDFAAGSVNDRLDTMLVADGAVYQYTANALELAPSGGGGGGGSTTVRMGPFEVRAEGQASDLPLDINKGATHGIDCILVDAQGTGVDLTGATLSTKVYNTAGTLVATISGTSTYAAGGAMTWTIPTSVTNTAGTYTATITRTTGASDTEVFGPLRIYVRDI